MPIVTCPLPVELERLLLGSLPDAEEQLLEQHVLQCNSCREKLDLLFRAKDTLAQVLIGNTKNDAAAASPALAELVIKLKAMRPGNISSLPGSQSDVSDAPTDPPVSESDVTFNDRLLDSDGEISLTDFLAPAQSDQELGRLGKYRILKVLGHGGMGVVYLAEDSMLKRPVAIKAMLPILAASASCGKRFLREAQAMAAVEHDHIVRIYEVDHERGIPFFAMEFLKGERLDERLGRGEPLPLTEILRISREIAEALSTAHGSGLIHRDIKPSNIWLQEVANGQSCRVKILDFGLTLAASQDVALTRKGAIIGTPAYMAPEQGRGDAVDARSDLFSLGSVLYQMCTGQRPFNGPDTISTLMAVATNEPAAPIKIVPELPQELSDLVMKLLEKNRDKRYATAAEVACALHSMETKLAQRRASDKVGNSTPCAVPAPEKKLDLPPLAEEKPETLITAAVPPRPLSACGPAVLEASTRSLMPEPVRSSNKKLTVALLVGGALALLAGLVFYWQTNNGIVRIEINDPGIQVSVDDKELIFKNADKQDLRVSAGGHGLHVKRGQLEFDTVKPIVVKRGETVTLKIDWQEGKLQAVLGDRVIGKVEVAIAPPVKVIGKGDPGEKVIGKGDKLIGKGDGVAALADAWTRQVAALSAKEQVKAVADKLQERNPGFNGKIRSHAINKAGVVTELAFCSKDVKDISPLRALPGLRKLTCGALQSGPTGMLGDLSPLKDLKLTSLAITHTIVADLSPLQGMPLTYLNCSATHVADLAPLKGMPLTGLNCSNTKVSDLAPLRNMKLTRLECNQTKVANLAPLQGMPLTFLNCSVTQIADLLPLTGMPLTSLNCSNTAVADLTPLQGMRLTYLSCSTTKVADLTPLQGMPLTSLHCGNTKVVSLAPLQGLPLTFLNCSMTQAADLAPLKGMPLTNMNCFNTKVADLAPLKDMKLTRLECNQTKVANLAPLRGMPLTYLNCSATQVADLAPLKGMLLTNLSCSDTKVSQLAPLQGMPLTSLNCSGTQVADLAPLNGMSLTNLNCSNTKVSDLAPLKNMKLTRLECSQTKVSNLTPLQGMSLTYLTCAVTQVSDLVPLQGMPLATLNCLNTRVVDLAPLKGMPLTNLNCWSTKVADLTPLKGMPLTNLNIGGTLVFDLTPLKGTPLAILNFSNTKVVELAPLTGMPLTSLNCGDTRVADLAPLKDMPLTILRCDRTPVVDLSPLRNMPLEALWCNFKAERDTQILRSIKTLKKINNQQVERFWM